MNRMGAVLGGLIVSLALGLLLSIFVPDENVLLALVVLGLAEAMAVGFTVRYLTDCRGWSTQLTALVLTTIGIHVMVTTGTINQYFSGVNSMMSDVSSLMGDGYGASSQSGPGWDEAVIGALYTPAISAGALLGGIVAAIIAGWGIRTRAHHVRDADA